MAVVEIPSKHKALVYDNLGSISTRIKEIDTPKPGPGEVLVNLTHSGVCHSDMGIMCNAWAWLPTPPPKGQVGGHEGVGKIVALGQGTENIGLKIGDRVGIKWIAYTCGHCTPCLVGADASCTSGKISTTILGLSSSTLSRRHTMLHPSRILSRATWLHLCSVVV